MQCHIGSSGLILMHITHICIGYPINCILCFVPFLTVAVHVNSSYIDFVYNHTIAVYDIMASNVYKPLNLSISFN